MGVPTSQVGYTPDMLRREDHEVHKDMWLHWTKQNYEGKPSFKIFTKIVHRDSFMSCGVATPTHK